MRPSEASRSFARRHRVLLVAAAVLCELVGVGWHRVVRTPDNASHLVLTPEGRGWTHVLSADYLPNEFGCVALWINPVRMAVAIVPLVMTAWAMVALMELVVGAGVRRSLSPAQRDEGRFGAALHYGSVWYLWVWLAAVVFATAPLFDLWEVARWPLSPPRETPLRGAAAMMGVTALMWWLFMLRLAQTSPLPGRRRLTTFVAIAPLIVGGIVAVWQVGLTFSYEFCWPLLRLTW